LKSKELSGTNTKENHENSGQNLELQ